MKRAFAAIAFVALIFAFSGEARAAGGCPQSADNLQEFAGCLAPVKGTVGMVYKGTLASLDGDHRQLLNSMNRGPVVPPQVVVPYPMYGSPFYNPFGPSMARAAAFVAATKRGYPSYWWMMGPYMY
ncbi:MAG TPA: hypothetical protein PLZ86_03315 [bacterium]|nr:hypothetical protein [bacterium]